jgi:uncharacterized protein YndB with AHSA1/START domain
MALTIDHTLDINAPAAVVWEVITDLPRYPEWNPFVLRCASTLQPGDPIDMRVQLKDERDQREWITAHEPGRYLAYRMKPVPLGALSSERSHEVQAVDAGRARYRSHFQLRGWLAWLPRTLLGEVLHSGFSGMSQGIKRRAEALWAQRKPPAD